MATVNDATLDYARFPRLFHFAGEAIFLSQLFLIFFATIVLPIEHNKILESQYAIDQISNFPPPRRHMLTKLEPLKSALTSRISLSPLFY